MQFLKNGVETVVLIDVRRFFLNCKSFINDNLICLPI